MKNPLSTVTLLAAVGLAAAAAATDLRIVTGSQLRAQLAAAQAQTVEPEPAAPAAAPAPGENPHAAVFALDPRPQAAPHDMVHDAFWQPGDNPHAPSANPHQGNPHIHAQLLPALPVDELEACERSRAENGHTVAELHASRSQLQSKRVSVRGTVVKVTPGILGKTYLHLRDGSGNQGARDNDLTVVTTDAVELGDTVEAEGTLVTDRDLGFGYRYDVLLEQARIKS